jgi:hypothetical protein
MTTLTVVGVDGQHQGRSGFFRLFTWRRGTRRRHDEGCSGQNVEFVAWKLSA